jgi:hypothetical protein
LCGLASSRPGFPIGITQESLLKPLDLDLPGVWSYGEVLALAGSHPRTVIQAPLRCQVSDRYPARELGTVPTRQVTIVQPLWVIKTLTDRVRAHAAHPSNNLDGTVGRPKSLAQTKIVHMELSPHLSF